MTGKGKNSLCIHEGEIKDTQFGGAVSPIFMASSYPFLDVDQNRYPRNFNTPNQEVVAKKVAALENAEAGLSFGSGMAAIATALLAKAFLGQNIDLAGWLGIGFITLGLTIIAQFSNIDV